MWLIQDLIFALRQARHNFGSTFILIVALSLGIGLTTSIFSVVYTVLLKPLPFHDPDRLALIMERLPQIPTPINLPPAQALELSKNPAFSEAAIFISSARNLESGDRPERVDVLRASPGLLPLLGIYPLHGRSFTRQEDIEGVRVALISSSFGQRRFGIESKAIGKLVVLDGMNYEIVGVLPSGLSFPAIGMLQSPRNADIWVPLSLTPSEQSPQNPDYSYSLIARLRRGFTVKQAQVGAAKAIERIMSQFPPQLQGKIHIEAAILPLKEQIVAGSRTLLFLLIGVVAALLLISCMNVSSLLLYKALARRRELALRVALGAEPKRIILQLLNETLLLFVTGGVIGTLCAVWLERGLIHLLPPDLPRLEDVHINAPVLEFAVTISVITGLIFGMAPALSAFRADLAHNLNDGSRSHSAGPSVGRVRRVLVITQIAVTFVLLTTAGLLLRSFSAVIDKHAFLRTEKVLSFGLALSKKEYPGVSKGQVFYRELSRRLKAIPGVLAVGIGTDIPFENRSGRLISPEHASVDRNPIVYNTDVEGAYFQALLIPVIAGRVFDAEGRESEPVAVVNSSFNKAFWKDNKSIDHRFKFGPPSAPGPWIRIIGVVADSAARDPDKPTEPHIYIPLAQDPYQEIAMREAWFVVRAGANALNHTQTVYSAVHSLDPVMPLIRLRTMEQVVSSAVAPRNANTWLTTAFSLAALLLTSLGIYGVLAESVAQRTREIATRIALGATQSDISGLVVREGAKLVLCGIAIGIPASFATSRLMQTLLYGISPEDWTTRLGVVAAITVALIVVMLIPVWRAINVKAQVALHVS